MWNSGRPRGNSRAPKTSSEGENFGLNWHVCLNADEPELTTM